MVRPGARAVVVVGRAGWRVFPSPLEKKNMAFPRLPAEGSPTQQVGCTTYFGPPPGTSSPWEDPKSLLSKRRRHP